MPALAARTAAALALLAGAHASPLPPPPLGLRGGGARAAQVQCSADAAGDVPPGSGADAWCSGSQCCSEYRKSFPCPAATQEWRDTHPCILEAMQTAPWNGTYGTDPDAPRPAVAGAYGPVVGRPGHLSVVELLRSKPGIADAEVVEPTEPGFRDAFYPPSVQSGDDWYYWNVSYPQLWGDLGSVFQPGMGGIRTVNAVRITPRADRPLKLYRVTHWDPEETSYMCGIWWGLEDTYRTTAKQVEVNVAMCSEPSSVVQCEITEPVLAVVGQGWDLDRSGFLERGCINATTGEATSDMAAALIADGYQDPPESVLQVVIPGCQLAQQMRSTCKACPLPGDLLSVTDVASYADAPPDPSACLTDLLERKQGARPSREEEARRRPSADLSHR